METSSPSSDGASVRAGTYRDSVTVMSRASGTRKAPSLSLSNCVNRRP